MVPRPLLNGERMHRHIVTCSTSSAPVGVSPGMYIFNDLSGVTNFIGGPGGVVISPNMSVSFSLLEMVVSIGGTLACTVPLPGGGDLQQLYDTFQIEKVEFSMFFNCMDANSTVGVNQGLPLIGYVPDTTDAASTNFVNLEQYSNFKIHQSNSALKTTLVPCAAAGVFDPSIGGPPALFGFSRAQRQDINVGYGKTPHYGMKLAVDGMRANSGLFNQAISVQAKVYLLMKGTR